MSRNVKRRWQKYLKFLVGQVDRFTEWIKILITTGLSNQFTDQSVMYLGIPNVDNSLKGNNLEDAAIV